MKTREHAAVIAIPCLNEAKHIERILDHFLDTTSLDLWVLDGGSTDATIDLVKRRRSDSGRIKLISNTEKLQAAAVNLAASLADQEGYEILLRVDAHANYSRDFATKVIDTLIEEEVSSVVVHMKTIGGNPFQDACADLFNSPLGAGNSAHRLGGKRGLVDHGHHAGFFIRDFLSLDGGYDTRFQANEDAEFDIRLKKAGKKIFFEDNTEVEYIPRPTVKGLMKQYFRNGYFRSQTFQKHKIAPSIRQTLPTLVSISNFSSLGLSLFLPLSIYLPVCYLVLVLTLATRYTSKLRPLHILRISLGAIVSHHSFGAGMVIGYTKGFKHAQ